MTMTTDIIARDPVTGIVSEPEAQNENPLAMLADLRHRVEALENGAAIPATDTVPLSRIQFVLARVVAFLSPWGFALPPEPDKG